MLIVLCAVTACFGIAVEQVEISANAATLNVAEAKTKQNVAALSETRVARSVHTDGSISPVAVTTGHHASGHAVDIGHSSLLERTTSTVSIMGDGNPAIEDAAKKEEEREDKAADPTDPAERDPEKEEAIKKVTPMAGIHAETKKENMFFVDPKDVHHVEANQMFLYEINGAMAFMVIISCCVIKFTCSKIHAEKNPENEEEHEEYAEKVSEELLGGMFELEDEHPSLPCNIYGEAMLRICKYLDTKRHGENSWTAYKEMFASVLLLMVSFVLVCVLMSVAQQSVGELREEKERRVQMMAATNLEPSPAFKSPLNTFVNRDWAAFMATQEVQGVGDQDGHLPIWNLVADIKYCEKLLTKVVPYWNAMGQWFMCATCAVFFLFYAKILMELRESLGLLQTLMLPTLPEDEDMCTIIEKEAKEDEHGDKRKSRKSVLTKTEASSSPLLEKEEEEEEKAEKETHINGYNGEAKFWICVLIFLPKIVITVAIAYIGTMYLLANSVSSELQELLITTIELQFVLELDEIMFESFTNNMKKEELESAKLPKVRVAADSAAIVSLTEYVCLTCCILMTYILVMTTYSARLDLNPHNQQVIEGCCNLENFLNGRGEWVVMRYENECREFREKYFESTVEAGHWADKWERTMDHFEVPILAR